MYLESDTQQHKYWYANVKAEDQSDNKSRNTKNKTPTSNDNAIITRSTLTSVTHATPNIKCGGNHHINECKNPADRPVRYTNCVREHNGILPRIYAESGQHKKNNNHYHNQSTTTTATDRDGRNNAIND